jgi:hypothetical protein
LATTKYYSPRVDRDLVSALYHAAKSHHVPMTRLASMLIREGLVRLSDNEEKESAIVHEEPPAPDPRGRHS